MKVGDRVTDITYGPGVIEEIDTTDNSAWVVFDNPKYADWVALKDLKHEA